MVTRRTHPTHTADRLRIRRVVVEGESMAPLLLDGDRLLVRPVRQLVRGDVVAARDPRQPERILVKRVDAVDDHAVILRGDNATASTDSRHFGPVARQLVLGRIFYRYAPAVRSGRWPPRE